jgi:predicted amidohydrolase
MTSDQINIVLIQPDIVWQDAGKNRLKYNQLLNGITEKSDLVILPEMFTTGFCNDAASLAETMQGESLKWMQETARYLHSAVAGSLIIREEKRYYNRLIYTDHLGKTGYYDKRHLFRMAGEEAHYTPGTRPLIVDTGLCRVSFQICYDLRFPVWSRNRNDYDLLVYVSNWPAARSDVWNILLRARAIENQCYVAAVNRVGTDGNGISYIGESMVIDPKGKVIADRTPSSEGLIRAVISLDELNAFREKFPVWKDWDDWVLAK